MTVASEITKLQTNLTNSYTACQVKGATLPAKQNFDNLPATIESITGGGGGSSEYKKLYNMDISDLIPEPNASGAIVIPTTASVIQSFDGVKSIPAYCFNYRFAYLTNIKEAHYPDLKTISTYSLNYAYQKCTGLTKICFEALETITTSNSLQRVCSDCTNLKIAELPLLKTITNTSGMSYAFYGCGLTSVIFPNLETATGLSYCFQNNKSLTYLGFPKLKIIKSTSSGMGNMVNGCTSLQEVEFPELESIESYMGATNMFSSSSVKVVRFTKLNNIERSCCSSMFSSCKTIEHVYFPALTTSSFGSSYTDQFNSMMSSTGTLVTHTLHFPANMEATISKLKSYPLFGGSDGHVVLAFDLPATS
jgi:hypothetical protein